MGSLANSPSSTTDSSKLVSRPRLSYSKRAIMARKLLLLLLLLACGVLIRAKIVVPYDECIEQLQTPIGVIVVADEEMTEQKAEANCRKINANLLPISHPDILLLVIELLKTCYSASRQPFVRPYRNYWTGLKVIGGVGMFENGMLFEYPKHAALFHKPPIPTSCQRAYVRASLLGMATEECNSGLKYSSLCWVANGDEAPPPIIYYYFAVILPIVITLQLIYLYHLVMTYMIFTAEGNERRKVMYGYLKAVRQNLRDQYYTLYQYLR